MSWNCNMAFGRKRELVVALRPDLLILQEVSRREFEELPAGFTHWVGANTHKGLAVVGFGDDEYAVAECGTEELPWFIPIRIGSTDKGKGESKDFELQVIAVWACVKTPQFRYVRVTHAALDRFEAFIRAAPTIMAEDFNSNTFWDAKHGTLGHTQMNARLEAVGLRSIYHALTGEKQGEELTHTWYLYRNRAKGYHIDYVYLPDGLIPDAALGIGRPDDWLPQSDHMPLTLDLPDSRLVSPSLPSIADAGAPRRGTLGGDPA